MATRYPQLPFERFADHASVHCRREAEAQEGRAAIAARLRECGLELHPEKTKVVYCKDDDRQRTYPNEKFDFLGYTFRRWRSKNRKGKARWAERKYKKLRSHLPRATHWIARISRRDPKLWAHWQMGVRRGCIMGAV